MLVRLLSQYRFVASFSSQLILELGQLVLHVSDACLSVLPLYSQLSQAAEKSRHKCNINTNAGD